MSSDRTCRVGLRAGKAFAQAPVSQFEYNTSKGVKSMSNQPKKKAEEVKEEVKEERVHPFDSFWKFHKDREENKAEEKEAAESEQKKRPFWW